MRKGIIGGAGGMMTGKNERMLEERKMLLRIPVVTNAKEVVKRDQEVYVKVVSVKGQKLSWSMRDVDQDTGKDLLPIHNVRDNAPRANPAGGGGGVGGGSVKRLGLSGIVIT
ncbi:hypothetical protein GUJ93_ZPchr0002g23751 [Zizania palustris]|uniref:Uncharacterized protein n=1 Tax=Zizania palustris TaxID=103762 RepID=A0A8J5VVY8_ZIZPA|nr:hypothetical protein GUJ93_ZPchr0002g23751 [Zizania palustris]